MKEALRKEGKEDQWINMNQKFKDYRREMEEEQKRMEEKVCISEKLTQCYELFRLCKKTIREESGLWKDVQDERMEERKKLERL